MSLLKQFKEPWLALDRKNLPAKRSQNPGISTKSGGRVDYRAITAMQEFQKRVTAR